MQEINEAYEQVCKGNLTYSQKYNFVGCTSKEDIKKLYRKLALKYHPDTTEQTDRRAESLNDIFAKANAEFQADNQFVGDFQMEDDFETAPEPEPKPTTEPQPVAAPPAPVHKRMQLGRITFGEVADMFVRKKRRAKPVPEPQMSLFG